MKKISAFLMSILLWGSMVANSQVIISQIYEGTSYNKYIEITNIGSGSVNLASPQLTIKTYNNKIDISGTPNYTYNLTGTLAPGQCYLIRHGQATIPAYALTYTPGDTNICTNFNGAGTGTPAVNTDIITLFNGTTLVDIFAWGTFQYLNQSYYRNATIVAPNPTWTVGEWTSVTNAVVDAAAPNTIERLGYHLTGGSTTPSVLISSPADGATVYSANVNVAFTLYNFVMGTDGHIHYKLDGGVLNEYTLTTPIACNGLSAGTHKVVLTLVDNSHNALVPAAADSVTFTVNLVGPPLKTIYQIQYTTLPTGDSPLKDSVVTTSGIVTASFASGYFIQDGTSPWNGLYVYDNTHTPALGDSITIGGTVSEYYNYTEFKTIVSYTTIATGKPIPAPIGVTTNSVKSEQYEGMLVKLTNAACTFVNTTAGWWKVLQGTDTCEIGKLMYPFPSAVVGTHYDVTGCVNYSFSQFMVEPRMLSDIEVNSAINENEISNISMFPNPATTFLNITNIEGVQQLRITNLLGEIIETMAVFGNTTTISVSSFKPGIYFVSLVSENGVIGTRKFIKQ
ncbi:MAG: T9SS type A sorting domain-containing protein [Bacteroidota bacterium]